MPKDLVIVESPAKARTVERYLGGEYVAKASMGHVRDLPKRKMGVDIDGEGFHPSYSTLPDKRKVVSELRKASAQADVVYLATDPDREGEAISWHVMEAAKIDAAKARRVVFHEITRDAIREAFDNPRELDVHLINAQQARRILDRVVGYRLSPVLWSKVKRGLSAGRVQSVALRLTVDREQEIAQFVPEEYWTIDALLSKLGQDDDDSRFTARLYAVEGTRGRPKISNAGQAAEIEADLKGAAYAVQSVVKKEMRRRPMAPFITSTLQQEASRRLRFTAQRTMSVAQQLYEGLQVGDDGPSGLITYMRTDSTQVAASALQEAGEYIRRKFGDPYAAPSPRRYRTKSKTAQEAHEAIRPTSVFREPESLRPHLTGEQFRLYDLIWRRMVASQMRDALFDATTINAAANGASGKAYTFRANGSVLKFAGYRTVYVVSQADEDRTLPELSDGEPLSSRGLKTEQKFTEPPPRYSEPMLIRALEQQGIGRPSTYAPTLATILARDYVRKEEGKFVPTKLGIAVSKLLTTHFPDVMDVSFTAKVEEQLDEIANGQREWTPVLQDFYAPFDEAVVEAMDKAERVPRNDIDEESDEVCEKCERPMVIKSGRFGRFMACTGYPECKNTRPFESPEERAVRELVSEDVDELCGVCEKRMVVKNSQRGRFLGCTGYPECKNTVPLRVGVTCKKCGSDMIERKGKGRNSKIFYGCISYPDCKETLNPLPQPCPDCGKLLVAAGRSNAACISCEFKGRPPKFEPVEASA